MRKLAFPDIDDSLALASLGKRGLHVRTVAARRTELEARYAQYTEHCGNPWTMQEVDGFTGLKKSIHSLYNAPPAALGFISNLRSAMSGSCPVCGRDALGTLDHYLPKESYCEFSVYSRNLVPACDRCNNTKGDLVKGEIEGQRAAHPYFDEFLSRRVMVIRAFPPWEAPLLKAQPINVQGEEEQVVSWHIRNIIEPAGLLNYVVDLWSKLVRFPNPIFNGVVDANGVIEKLLQQAEIEAFLGGSENCWRSSFYYGVSESPGAADFLWQQIRN